MSEVDLLRQIENNYGVSFFDSHVKNPLFIINQGGSAQHVSKEPGEDLLYKLDDAGIISWCSEHYKDSYFAMFLAVCILDRRPYSSIYEMAMELKERFGVLADSAASNTEKESLVFKSQFVKVLGIAEYRDDVIVRKEKIETDFLRLPSPELAGVYLQLLAREFPEIKQLLSDYLLRKITASRRNPGDNTTVKGCIDALTYLGAADLQYFDTTVIPQFFGIKTETADYCLAMILYQLYGMADYRQFVRSCVEHWGRLENSPHRTLTALYICGMVGDQTYVVRDIWISVLTSMIREMSQDQDSEHRLLYMQMLPELFRSGERKVKYYEGVIHAFSYMVGRACEQKRRQDERNLYDIFLLGIMDDFSRCSLRASGKRKQDMLWVRIFDRIGPKTREKLASLWAGALKSRMIPKIGWDILEQYLAENREADPEAIERLALFFRCINQTYGGSRGMEFLNRCARRGQDSSETAKKIYERLEREKTNGR